MTYLIIKLGAMGDVLRTTPLLRRLIRRDPSARITWITSASSRPVLESNPMIHELVTVDHAAAWHGRHFDWALNADEEEPACRAMAGVHAAIMKGFVEREGRYWPVDQDAAYAYQLSQDDHLKFKQNRKTYQQILFDMAGVGPFDGEEMVLDLSVPHPGAGVALNHLVGDKWPTKNWVSWDPLAAALSRTTRVSRQRLFPTFLEYAQWLGEHAVAVVGDSLSLHVSVALKKRVVALFGPTCHHEIELYDRGCKLFVHDLFCAPCYKAVCPYHLECMTGLQVAQVADTVEQELRTALQSTLH